MVQTVEQLKSFFVQYARPGQAAFWDWLDSYRHIDDKITVFDLDPNLLSIIRNVTDWAVFPEELQNIANLQRDMLSAAQQYADAQDALRKIESAAYADGKVTAEEQRAIADAQQKLAEAKSYAENKAASAEAAAKDAATLYAANKAAAARTEAEQAAKQYADAQDALRKTEAAAYADGKVTAEEQRAIADAQQKLSEAKAHAEAKATEAKNIAASYTDTKFAEVNTTASNAVAHALAAQQANATLVRNLRGMAYKDVAELADLGVTVIENGKVKTTLLDAEYIRTSIVNAAYVNTLQLDAAAIKSGVIDTARLNVSQIVSGLASTAEVLAQRNEINAAILSAKNESYNFATAEAGAARTAAILAASQDAAAKLAEAKTYTDIKNAELVVDTRNLLRYSEFVGVVVANVRTDFTSNNVISVAKDIKEVGVANKGGLNSWMLNGTGREYAGFRYFGFVRKQQYTASCYAVSTDRTDITAAQVSVGVGWLINSKTAATTHKLKKIADGVYLLSWTFDYPDVEAAVNLNNYTRVFFYKEAGGSAARSILFTRPKLSQGSTVSGWSIAPEDLEENFRNAQQASDIAAKQYADAQDALRKTEANAYADGKVTAEEQRAIADAQAKLEDAKTDATAKAAAAEQAAKAAATNYTDLKISLAQQGIDDAIAKVVAEQQQHTVLVNNLRSLAYKDAAELSDLGTTIIQNGKIKTVLLDAEYIRSQIINAAYVNTLQLDATAIKTGVIDVARLNALQIILQGGGAKAADVADMQAALNGNIDGVRTSLTNSISSNVSALQGSISNTLAEAKNYTNNIKIGERNLLLNSNKYVNDSRYNLVDYTVTENIAIGETVTLLIKGSLGADRSYFQMWNLGGRIDYSTKMFESENGIYKSTFTLQNPIAKGSVITIYHMFSSAVSKSTIEWIKLVKGVKTSDDWVAAHEDFSNGISDAKQAALNYTDSKVAATDSVLTALKTSLKSLAYTDVVEYAKLGTTILQGGYFKTELINSGAVVSQGGGLTTAAFAQAKLVLDNAISAAQNSANAANSGVASLDSRLTVLQNNYAGFVNTMSEVKNKTDNFALVAGGLISANIVMVGPDIINANAGMSGIGSAATDVRFFAGSNADNRATAPFRVDQRGNLWSTQAVIRSANLETEGGVNIDTINKIIEMRYATGIVGLKISLLPEGPAMEFYNPSGTLVYRLGQGGFYYVNSTPESMTAVNYFIFTNVFSITPTDIEIEELKDVAKHAYRQRGGYRVEMYAQSNTYYYYEPGNNEYSQINAQYKGLHITNNKTSPFIQSGWWLTYKHLLTAPDEQQIRVQYTFYNSGSILDYLIIYINKSEFLNWDSPSYQPL